MSARLDGEAEPVAAADTDAHLAGCAACRDWRRRAEALTRAVRVRPVEEEVPDLTAAALAAAPPPRRRLRVPAARVALAAIGFSQVLLGLAQAFLLDAAHHSGTTHLFNESTAWNLALGVGLVWTARWPRATSGTLPVVAGFVAVLVPFAAQDLMAGAVSVSRVTTHAILVLGLVALVIVHRDQKGPQDGDSTTATPGASGSSGLFGSGRRSPAGRLGRRPHLRPVSRRDAA